MKGVDNQEENTVFDFDNEKTEDGIEEKATEANENTEASTETNEAEVPDDTKEAYEDEIIYDTTEANEDKIIKVTTEANADEFNEVNEDEVRQFSLELGAGPKRIKLGRESSGSAPPVFRYI